MTSEPGSVDLLGRLAASPPDRSAREPSKPPSTGFQWFLLCSTQAGEGGRAWEKMPNLVATSGLASRIQRGDDLRNLNVFVGEGGAYTSC